MSWDLFVQDWGNFESLDDISNDFEPQSIGKRSEVIDNIKAAEPTIDFSNPSWGILENEQFTIEFNMDPFNNIKYQEFQKCRRVSASVSVFCQCVFSLYHKYFWADSS